LTSGDDDDGASDEADSQDTDDGGASGDGDSGTGEPSGADTEEGDGESPEPVDTFEVTDAESNESVVVRGAPVEVVATVANSGDRDGAVTTELTANGEVIAERNTTVEAGANATVSFVETFDEAGAYALAVGNATGPTLTVRRPGTPGGIEVVDATLPSDWARKGAAVTVRTVVKNTGHRPFVVTVDGETVANETVTLPPGERREVAIRFDSTGGPVLVEGVEADQLRVSEQLGGDTETAADDGSPFASELPFAVVFLVGLTLSVLLVGIRFGTRGGP
jgi:FtsP/CotA-like multicopper oxidase with cupredoxin domain